MRSSSFARRFASCVSARSSARRRRSSSVGGGARLHRLAARFLFSARRRRFSSAFSSSFWRFFSTSVDLLHELVLVRPLRGDAGPSALGLIPRRFFLFSSLRFLRWCSLTFLMSLYFCFSVVRLDLDLVDFFGIVNDYRGEGERRLSDEAKARRRRTTARRRRTNGAAGGAVRPERRGSGRGRMRRCRASGGGGGAGAGSTSRETRARAWARGRCEREA